MKPIISSAIDSTVGFIQSKLEIKQFAENAYYFDSRFVSEEKDTRFERYISTFPLPLDFKGKILPASFSVLVSAWPIAERKSWSYQEFFHKTHPTIPRQNSDAVANGAFLPVGDFILFTTPSIWIPGHAFPKDVKYSEEVVPMLVIEWSAFPNNYLITVEFETKLEKK